MNYRYPNLQFEYDLDPEMGSIRVPNFILQPIVENSLLHGLKNKGYIGKVKISIEQISDKDIEIQISDTGSGFEPLKISLFEKKIRTEMDHHGDRPITAITRYLQEHLSEDVSLTLLSEEFHLNAQYISQLFKSEIGVGFLNYLTEIRMEKAKKILLSTSLSIAEVAEQVGYSDYRVFTKIFKKSEGNTPTQYRRDFQNL